MQGRILPLASTSRISNKQDPDGEPGDEIGAAGQWSNVAIHSTKEGAAPPVALGCGEVKNPDPQPVQGTGVPLENQEQLQIAEAV